MRRAALIDVVRTPFGKGREGGALSSEHPVDLYAKVIRALVERQDIDPNLIEDVITGCVLQVGEQAGNIGRQAALAAGLPESVPALTLDRKCGSAQQAIDSAAQGIIAGAYDVAIAGGVEMMSVVPMKMNRMGKDSEGPIFRERYPDGLVHQGIAAERIAARWQLGREELDRFSLMSHHKAAADQEAVKKDIVPIRLSDGGLVDRDEGIRAESNLEKMMSLIPAFENEEMKNRFPEISWSVTAASSSQVSDGAAACLLVEEKTAARLNLSPRAYLTHFAVSGDDPLMMLTGVIPATRKILKRAGLSIDDLEAYEVSEAFASVPLAWEKELRADPERLNVFGGAIAIGHPVGASGGRLVANLLRALESGRGQYGLVTMCESGGMANASLFERA
jgi:acetyl-CoA acyltransferase